MNPEAAETLLVETVEELFDRRKRPILGSQLKPALLAKARETKAEFDERALGYSGFLEFVSSSPRLAVMAKGAGMDFLVVPTHDAALLRDVPQATDARI